MHKYIRKHSTHQHHPFVKYQMHIATTIPGTKRQSSKPKHRKQTTFLAKHSMHWCQTKTHQQKPKPKKENREWTRNRKKKKANARQTESSKSKPKGEKEWTEWEWEKKKWKNPNKTRGGMGKISYSILT